MFGEVELIAPVYNAQSCRECHQNPINGGISQVTELRAGHFDGSRFARFMRSTLAPPRDEALASTPDALAGSSTFDRIGCVVCHVRTIRTADAGTPINGGAFIVPEALGNKLIHPFSDFLPHDVGAGDGIVQNGGAGIRNRLRTPPLWGLCTHGRQMHDGASLTARDAIQRHDKEAARVAPRFRALNARERRELLALDGTRIRRRTSR